MPPDQKWARTPTRGGGCRAYGRAVHRPRKRHPRIGSKARTRAETAPALAVLQKPLKARLRRSRLVRCSQGWVAPARVTRSGLPPAALRVAALTLARALARAPALRAAQPLTRARAAMMRLAGRLRFSARDTTSRSTP